MEKNVIL